MIPICLVLIESKWIAPVDLLCAVCSHVNYLKLTSVGNKEIKL
jgi:hypothetical protein